MHKIKTSIKDQLKKDLWPELHPLLDTISFEFVMDEVQKSIKEGRKVYPSPQLLFRAFALTPVNDVKVVILGQDPYPKGEATGLAFGVEDRAIPASLRNIYRELCDQFNHNVSMDDFDFSLESWAKQGVLLVNSSFTVEHGRPGSHGKLWDFILKDMFRIIKYRSPKAISLLMGKHAQSYSKFIDGEVIYTPHPAAESYSGGTSGFFGSGCFYQINDSLKVKGIEPIDWFKK